MTRVVVVTAGDAKTPEQEVENNKLKTAYERFELIKEVSNEDRKSRLADLKFRAGDQWPDDIIQDRATDGRPALTINRLPQFIRLVTNDMRQNRPSITVSPTDEDATESTARVIQGMVRHIEYDSNADYAYDTAGDAQCTQGLGWLRVVTKYDNPKSFDQVIKIKRIRNSFSVYPDMSAVEPDYSDMKYCFVVEDMLKDEYKATYPDSKLSKMSGWEGDGNFTPEWVTKDGCRVAEYFFIENVRKKIYLMDDKSVYVEDELEKDGATVKAPNGRQIMGSRETLLPVVKWQKINGVEILEETEWLGQWIPVVPVIGDEIEIDGRVTYEGIVRHAKDPQRMYNYWASSETETIALAPRAPFIGAEGQFSAGDEKWKTSNRKSHAYLEYKPITLNGNLAPPPQRNVQEPPVRAITQAREMAGEDMKATTGTFDPALGEKGNETSGVAIAQRKMQHGTTNFHYSDNMARSIRHLGRIVVELIPKIYDGERVIRIIHPDGTNETVTINAPYKDQQGVDRMYDIRKGKYDVVVSAGPSYATKRQETVATMLQLAMAYPPIVQAAGDLMVKSMDWEGANEIADRLKKMLPPQLQDTSNVPPAVQQQMQQMQGLIKQLTVALNKTTTKLETKVLDNESKERIALNKIIADLVITAEQMHHETNKLGFETFVDHINQQLDRVGEGQDPEAAARTGADQLSPTVAAANAAAGQDGNSGLPNGPASGQT